MVEKKSYKIDKNFKYANNNFAIIKKYKNKKGASDAHHTEKEGGNQSSLACISL